jgi:uncharacterized membrane protein
MGSWLFLLLFIALGFAAIRAAWPAPRRWSAADPLRLAAAPAFGIGICSCVYFLVRVVLQLAPGATLASIVLVLAAAAFFAWQRAGAAPPDPAAPPGAAPVWLWLLFAAAAGMAALTFLMLSGAAPHGEWDAWSIWNLRARFLFRAQEFVSPFSPAIDWSHPDYPLLLPGAIACLWSASGAETPAIAAAVGLLFTVSAIAVPLFVLSLLRGRVLALVCAISILGATSLVRVGASLYADVPLAAFFVIAGALLVYALEADSAGSGPALLAGFAAGLAGWTKNEGLLFCVSLVIAFCISVNSRAELRRRVHSAVPLLAGLAAVLVLVGYFKLRMAPPNDLVNASNTGVFGAKMVDFARYWATFWAFVGEFLTFGNILVPPVIVFAAWLAIVRIRPALTGAALLPLVAVSLQLLGYIAVYVGTSKDLDWHLNTSLPRLLLHVWPLAVTGIFLISGNISTNQPQPATAVPRSK